MAKQTYIKRDLIDYVDGDVEIPPKESYRRPAWVIHNLPAKASVQYWKQGGYQGKLAFVIRLDGYVWLFNDYYGSCSGCDSFLNNQKKYTEDMLRKAYCFPTAHAAHEYTKTTDDYSWEGVKTAVHEMIEDRDAHLKNPKTRFEVTRKEKAGKYGAEMSGLEIIHQEADDD